VWAKSDGFEVSISYSSVTNISEILKQRLEWQDTGHNEYIEHCVD
jgi:hypothetical protein